MSKVMWLHPSYRDVVIDELVSNTRWRRLFLNIMYTNGLALALSSTGGSSGDRDLPLLQDEDDWNVLRRRCRELIGSSPEQVLAIFSSLLEFGIHLRSYSSSEMSQIRRTTREVCLEFLKCRIDYETTHLGMLRSYAIASLYTSPLVPLPDLAPIWSLVYQQYREYLCIFEEEQYITDTDPLEQWTQLIKFVSDNEPRLLRQLRFPDAFSSDINRILKIVNDELEFTLLAPTRDEAANEIDRLDLILESLHVLASHAGGLGSQFDRVLHSADERRTKLQEFVEQCDENDRLEPDDEAQKAENSRADSVVNIDALFADL